MTACIVVQLCTVGSNRRHEREDADSACAKAQRTRCQHWPWRCVLQERLACSAVHCSNRGCLGLVPCTYEATLAYLWPPLSCCDVCMNQPTEPYQGYGATLLSFGPFSALFFMLHEEVRPGTYGDSWCLITPSVCVAQFKEYGTKVLGDSSFGLYALR